MSYLKLIITNSIDDACANLCTVLQEAVDCALRCPAASRPDNHECLAFDKRWRWVQLVFLSLIWFDSLPKLWYIMQVQVYVVSTRCLKRHNLIQEFLLACTMIFDPKMFVQRFTRAPWANKLYFHRSVIASSSAWLPLLYDTVAMGLTLYRTIPSIRDKHTAHVMRRLLEDGLLYYTFGTPFTVVWFCTLIGAYLTVLYLQSPSFWPSW